MININKSGNKITVSGHAMYNNYGKDIVCASVSSIVICTANAIEKINKENIKCMLEKDKMTICFKDDEITIKLISNMLDMLKELENEYKGNIRLKEE